MKLNRYELDVVVEWHQQNNMKADLSWADLRWADLRWANLSWANLSWADLRWADLRWADLRGANLRGANLRWADLRGANLRGANLSGADLRGANLRGANLSGADLRWANLSWADLRGANLRGADLSGADLSGADLSGADLSGATISINDHQSIAYVIRSLGTIKAIALAGLIEQKKEWCWDVWLNNNSPAGANQDEWDWLVNSQRQNAIDALAQWDFDLEAAPSVIADARRAYLAKQEEIKDENI